MPDYNFLMESRLKPAQSRVVSQMGRLAATQGLNLYLAGGAVRDLTLGSSAPRGLEFVVEGNIQRLIRPLTAGVKEKPRPAGVVPEEPIDLKVESLELDAPRNRAEVVFEGAVPGEIVSARNETYTSPGRPPAISPGTIFDDLRRRDFSANAMAVSLHPFSRGLLLDPTNGASDLERKELRALHSRSFFDDPSRIYRLIRLAIRLDFKPDEKTTRWLEAALAEKMWEHLREDQQGRELRAVLEEDLAGKVLKALHDRGVLGGLDRKLAAARIEFDRFERVRNAVRITGESSPLYANFLALVEKLPGERARLAKKIFGDAGTVKLALGVAQEASKLAKVLGSAKAAKPSQVYTILSTAPPPLPVLLLVDHPQTVVQNRVKAFFTKFPAIRATAPRAELEAMGMPPGAKFEKVLEQVFLDQLDGKLKTPPQLTKALRTYSGIKEPPPAPPPPQKGGAKAPAAKDAAAKGSKPAGPAPAPQSAAQAKPSQAKPAPPLGGAGKSAVPAPVGPAGKGKKAVSPQSAPPVAGPGAPPVAPVKPAEAASKAAVSKPAGPKPTGPKPAGPKPAVAKPTGPKPAEPKPAGPKPIGPKPATAKSAAPKPEPSSKAAPKPVQPAKPSPGAAKGRKGR
jgi:tRNA nucleotidyltransferase (CCA-adding enzyme)